MSDNLLDHILIADSDKSKSQQEVASEQVGRIQRILAGCNPHQVQFLLDQSDYKALRCPRRAGKSFAMAALAVYVGESMPGARILVISLTLKSTKENYWSGGTSGIFTMDRKFNLGLKYNHTDCVWWHQNGSRGRLAGAETRADIEYLRGAAAEADVVILDECKSFAPSLLQELIREVLEPGLMTRDGKIVMGGTPGLIPEGPFWQATCEDSVIKAKDEVTGEETSYPTCVVYDPARPTVHRTTFINDEGEEEAVDTPWSLHSWTIKENTAAPKQWARALRIKSKNKWGNDHPTWNREYLGRWVMDGEGHVYAYAGLKPEGKVTWIPERTPDNKSGLPKADGPWHYVFGLDLGFEDPTALVVCAYSEKLAQLRHVYDYKESHLTVAAVAELVQDAIKKYGMPVAIVADAAGAQIIADLNQTYGLPVQKAEKTEKMDFIELLNSDFHTGHIKIIEDTDLEDELCALQWDLSEAGKAELARRGKLKEDYRLPNHLCDALLYLWRFAYHHFARPDHVELLSDEELILRAEREEEMRQAFSRRTERKFNTDGHPALNKAARPMTRDSLSWRL